MLELGNDRAHQHVDLALVVAIFLGKDRDLGREVVTDHESVDLSAFATLDEHLDGAVRQLQELQDRREGADLIEILGARIVHVGRLLGDEQDLLAACHCTFQRHDRFLPADEQRDHHVRIDDDVTERQYRDAGGIVRRRDLLGLRFPFRFQTLAISLVHRPVGGVRWDLCSIRPESSLRVGARPTRIRLLSP